MQILMHMLSTLHSKSTFSTYIHACIQTHVLYPPLKKDINLLLKNSHNNLHVDCNLLFHTTLTHATFLIQLTDQQILTHGLLQKNKHAQMLTPRAHCAWLYHFSSTLDGFAQVLTPNLDVHAIRARFSPPRMKNTL